MIFIMLPVLKHTSSPILDDVMWWASLLPALYVEVACITRAKVRFHPVAGHTDPEV